MTDLRKAANEVLEAWGWDVSEPRNKMLRERMEALSKALAQPEDLRIVDLRKAAEDLLEGVEAAIKVRSEK